MIMKKSVCHLAQPFAEEEKLTQMIFNSPDVEFCGYSIPHPSEATMNLRIQTWGMQPNRFHTKPED